MCALLCISGSVWRVISGNEYLVDNCIRSNHACKFRCHLNRSCAETIVVGCETLEVSPISDRKLKVPMCTTF